MTQQSKVRNYGKHVVAPNSPFLCKKYKKQPKTSQKWLVFGCFLVEAAGLDSRANCALGLPRSRTSTGSPLCTVSPSSPLHDKEKEDIPQGHTFFYLVEAAGLEPTVSSTRNWRDTTFATPRNVKNY